jgi:hypothetical protein
VALPIFLVAETAGCCDCFAAGTCAELAKDRRDVVVDGSPRDHEPLCDLGVPQAFAQ